MRYVTLGRTGLEVSRLGFGCIKFGEESQDTVTEALQAALDNGINFLDTARGYGPSEEMIGRAVSDRRDEFYIATKTGRRDYEGAKSEIEKSLSNLQTDYIDIYQLHNVATPEDWEAVMAEDGALSALIEAREEGTIGHIGITIHRSITNMLRALQEDVFATIMLYCNPLDEEHVEAEVLPVASDSELGVIGMKALSGGSLVMPPELKQEKGLTKDPIVEGCLRYVLGHPHVDVVIPGMRNAAEVEENLATETMPPLSEKEEQELMQAIGELKGTYKYDQRCLQCGYCQPCPQDVDIPAVFRAAFMWEHYPDSVKDEARAVARGVEAGPEQCVECGECTERCPAGIDIPQRLQERAEIFGRLQAE